MMATAATEETSFEVRETSPTIVNQILELTLDEKMAKNPEAFDFSDILENAPAVKTPGKAEKRLYTLVEMMDGVVAEVTKRGQRYRVLSSTLEQELQIVDLLTAIPETAKPSEMMEAKTRATLLLLERWDGQAWVPATYEEVKKTFKMEELNQFYNLSAGIEEGEEGANPPR